MLDARVSDISYLMMPDNAGFCDKALHICCAAYICIFFDHSIAAQERFENVWSRKLEALLNLSSPVYASNCPTDCDLQI